ncbi:hypothetical protein VKT23_006227 [Stygiomarasmius scandens]|uniref:Uncharacterized protein n=1 Tax=Marasmiellus scandens TaxID=2682957 RepID=A0ABR1JRU7_9AGAR
MARTKIEIEVVHKKWGRVTKTPWGGIIPNVNAQTAAAEAAKVHKKKSSIVAAKSKSKPKTAENPTASSPKTVAETLSTTTEALLASKGLPSTSTSTRAKRHTRSASAVSTASISTATAPTAIPSALSAITTSSVPVPVPIHALTSTSTSLGLSNPDTKANANTTIPTSIAPKPTTNTAKPKPLAKSARATAKSKPTQPAPVVSTRPKRNAASRAQARLTQLAADMSKVKVEEADGDVGMGITMDVDGAVGTGTEAFGRDVTGVNKPGAGTEAGCGVSASAVTKRRRKAKGTKAKTIVQGKDDAGENQTGSVCVPVSETVVTVMNDAPSFGNDAGFDLGTGEGKGKVQDVPTQEPGPLFGFSFGDMGIRRLAGLGEIRVKQEPVD